MAVWYKTKDKEGNNVKVLLDKIPYNNKYNSNILDDIIYKHIDTILINSIYVLPPKLDRLVLLFDIPDSVVGEKGVIYNLITMAEDEEGKEPFSPYIHKSFASKSYTSQVEFTPTDANKKIIIQTKNKPKCPGITQLRIDWSPNVVGKEGNKSLQELIKILLGNQDNYKSFAIDSKITAMDVAWDIVNIGTHNIAYNYKTKRSKRVFYDNNGIAETIYIGKGKGEICIYEKVKQVKAISKATLDKNLGGFSEVTRVEFSINTGGMLLKDIKGLQGEFDKLELFDLRKADITHGDRWEFFKRACAGCDVKHVLNIISEKKLREAYEKAVYGARLELWKPEEKWADWGKVIDGLGILP